MMDAVTGCSLLMLMLLFATGARCGTFGAKNEDEPGFTEPISNITIPVGRDLQLPCRVRNSGLYRVAWIKLETRELLTIDIHTITKNNRISVTLIDKNNFVLNIRNVRESDQGEYKCQINAVPKKNQIVYVDVLETTDEVEPKFAEPIPNITILVGQDLQLPCRVDNLGSYRVAWIKVETKKILTIDIHNITDDHRISVSRRANSKFVLNIRNVLGSDQGEYMCQINTIPMKKQIAYVDVLATTNEVEPEFAEPIPNITILAGRDLQLPCRVDNLGSYRVAWIKVETKEILTNQLHTLTDDNRISVRLSNMHNFILNIRSVRESDRGEYMCQIKTAPMKSQIGYVDVSGTTNEVEPEFAEPIPNITITVGRDLQLPCRVGNLGSYRVAWVKGETMKIMTFDLQTTIDDHRISASHINNSNFILNIRNVRESDRGKYMCQITTVPMKRQIGYVDVLATTNEVEPEFAEPIPNITIPLGRDLQLPCRVDNLGSYRVAWIKVETKEILTNHRHTISDDRRISVSHINNRNFILKIRNVRESDRGEYMCQIKTTPMKSQIGFVDILVPPEILMNESSTDITAREGTNVSLVCKARGYPNPNIFWRREDNMPFPVEIWPGKKTFAISFDGSQLDLHRVSKLHIGAYLCIASNGLQPSVSRRIFLHVNYNKSEDAVAAHEDYSQSSNEKRDQSGSEEVSEKSASAGYKTKDLTLLLISVLAVLLTMST